MVSLSSQRLAILRCVLPLVVCAGSCVKSEIQAQTAAATSPLPPSPDLTPAEVASQQNYNQPLRPQFHYTALQGHIGDATGLFSYRGEYHLFNIFDEWSRRSSAHKRWGHAVSFDLVHWQQLPALLDTIVDHAPGSGSGVVDWNNSSGLRVGPEKTLLIFYTDYKKGSSVAYSRDRGRTWIRYAANPVLDGYADIRDPNVFWYPPTNDWRMIRYEKQGFAFYHSADLLHWDFLSRMDGFYECPDLFELPVQNAPGESRWVLVDGNGSYVVGRFDGSHFDAETPKLKVEYGPAFYATQTWKRHAGTLSAIQIAWLKYPPQTTLTWDGQMTFPANLSLVQLPEGIRLIRQPIDAISDLVVATKGWRNLAVGSNGREMRELQSGLYDLHVTIDPKGAQLFGLAIHGTKIMYSVPEQTLRVGDNSAPLRWSGGQFRLRILVDRSSLEVFTDPGTVSLSVITPKPVPGPVKLLTNGPGEAYFSIRADELESIWNGATPTAAWDEGLRRSDRSSHTRHTVDPGYRD